MRTVAHKIVYAVGRWVWYALKFVVASSHANRLFETDLARRIRGAPTKRDAHFMTWQEKFRRHNGSLEHLTDNYRTTMMGAGDITDLSFFDGKIVVDIGSGPACTLCWIPNAKARIGVDPLAGRFMQLGIASHDMLYLDAPGESVPLPSDYVDVVFSINALDHVEDPVAVMKEIDRILRPGGYFIGSIGLKEKPTFTEPHALTRKLIQRNLLQGWREEFSMMRPKGPSAKEFYRFFHEQPPADYKADELIWWCRYRKPGE